MPRVRPHGAMGIVLRRLNTHGREVEQVADGPTWVASCPNHDGRNGPAVRFDQRTNGTVEVYPHRSNGEIVCTPEDILGALAINDDRIKPYSSNGVGKAGDPFAKPARLRRQGPTEDSYAILERLKQALADKDCAGPRAATLRFHCPACGARGDGHGLRITHKPNASGKRKILLRCDTNECPPEEILEPLGMTLADICAGDDTDDLGEEDEVTPGRVTATVRSTSTVTTAPRTENVENGAELLDDVDRFLRAYVAFPSDAAAVAATLWAAHTHLIETFDSTPRLALLSPEKQCGKSRTLELLELLCAGAETLSDASASYLFRRIGAGAVTVLLDEGDAIWKRGKTDETAEALRSIVNAGHRRNATVGRLEMKGQAANLVRFPVYAPRGVGGHR